MDTYADSIKAKIPARIKIYPEYETLLRVVSENRIESKEALDAFMKKQGKQWQEFIDRNSDRPSVAPKVKEKQEELDTHQRIRLSLFRYL